MRRIVLFAAALVLSGAALAQQGYPNRPLRMVIPWPPGQATDLVGRVLALKLSEVLGQSVVPDNRAGAGGMIGTDFVAKSAPDGYTLLAASSGPVTVNPLLQKTAYDVDRDFVPVAKVGLSPYVLVTNQSFPAANAREFVALVKANPGKYSFASSGTGATAHLIAEWFNAFAELKVTHVPYKGSSPALTDVVGGQVAYALETVAATMPLVRSGRLRGYGITVANPTPLAPGIEPLANSLGLTGFDVGAWLGVMVPAGTPKPITDRLAAAVETVMKSPETRERLATVGLEVDYRPSEEFARYLKEQQTRFAEIIRKGGIRID
ncbi:MAG: tripartite tricarboxylate transporter substrate binding protein [Betaproteobacteria bacterium]|nr:tripartite tricarboxylate transporter substrate binding protein [Betaproteobacteria bacterium]